MTLKEFICGQGSNSTAFYRHRQRPPAPLHGPLCAILSILSANKLR
jgi:hypothetical protein